MTHRRCVRAAGAVVVSLFLTSATAKPLDVPPGSDPGGTAIAIITTPFDVTAPDVAARLARDGEGVAIGWDFSKPDDTQASGDALPDALASAWTTNRDIRLVPIFVDPARPETLAKGIAFAAKTPARIVATVLVPRSEVGPDIIQAGAQHFPELLFVVSAGTSDSQTHGNVLRVTNDETPADVAPELASDWADDVPAQQAALVATLATLVSCVTGLEDAVDGQTRKVLALSGLAALQSRSQGQSSGPVRFTPCAAARSGRPPDDVPLE